MHIATRGPWVGLQTGSANQVQTPIITEPSPAPMSEEPLLARLVDVADGMRQPAQSMVAGCLIRLLGATAARGRPASEASGRDPRPPFRVR